MAKRVHFLTPSGQPPPPKFVVPKADPPRPRVHYVTVSGRPPYGGIPPLAPMPEEALSLYDYDYEYKVVPKPRPRPPPPPAPGPAAAGALVPFAAIAPPPPPAPAAPAYSPPGLHLHGSAPFIHKGAAYLFPRNHTIVHFFHKGARPFDVGAPAEPEFAAFKVPSALSLAELMVQLGVPQTEGEDGRYGVTECWEEGGRGGARRWTKGSTWTAGGQMSERTKVEELGPEGEEKVVWLAAYDAEKHS